MLADISDMVNPKKKKVNHDKYQTPDKAIYSLELHEQIKCSDMIITRVAGGWIYAFAQYAVFIPFNNEFQRFNRMETINDVLVD